MRDFRKVATTANGNDLLLETIDVNFKDRIIWVVGEINDEKAVEVVSAILILARKSKDDIVMYINSPGGVVSAGLSIYDAAKLCGCDIVTVVTGMAASMAALLAATGTKGKRYAHPNSEIMIHQPLGGFGGQASDIKLQAEHILKTRKVLNRILAEAANKTFETIERDTERDYYMSAQQALEYGLIDWIGDPIMDEEESV